MASLVSLAGCATVQTIPISYEPNVSRRSVGRHDLDTAVKVIAAVMVEDLKLPAPDATVYLYNGPENREVNINGVVELVHGSAGSKSAAFARASCPWHKVLADRDWLATLSWRARVRTMAHEMLHLVQFAVADWSCAEPHYWLMEGFAQWGAYKILASLELQSFAEGVALFQEDVASAYRRGAFPSLNRLATAADWQMAERTVGREAAYGGSVMAVDFLIDRKGLAAVVDYFARFKDSKVRNDNFSAAFGEDVEAFQAEFSAHLKSTLM
ncbi:MAG TPA: hypothetical protein VGH50_07160 [Candidatus Binatia bacterium]|jgi:hypothetical protein